MNPLLQDWTAPFGLPPFGAVGTAHFAPAFEAALREGRSNIDAIAGNPDAPTFANTIEALEKSGRDLDKVANVFFVKAGADTGDEIEAIERDVSPLLARHSNALYLNRQLYARIADLYARRDKLGLNAEQARLLERYHLRFVRAGSLRIEDRRHFLQYAGRVMRSVIVDFVRERMAQRRGGDVAHVALDTGIAESAARGEDEILRVHEALEELAAHDERMVRVVEMRYFGGLSEAEIAESLGVTTRTVRRDWEKARLLLAESLK